MARACLPGLGDRIGRGLAVTAPHVLRVEPATGAPAPGRVTAGDEPVAPVAPRAASERAAPALGAKASRAGGTGAPKGAAPKSLRIPEAQVSRALGAGLDGVRGRTARDTEGRAVGVRITGVGRLGVGLADGDVITSIDGTKTPDEESATAAALAAIGRGARSVSGTLLRGNDTINVVVELPADSSAIPH